MKYTILIFILLSNLVFAADDIQISLGKFDASRNIIETNLLKVEGDHIYYVYENDKGNLRPLLPGELEKIIKAMKSQLSNAILENQTKPKGTFFYRFSFEYDVGARDIRYDVEGINFENELSLEMKELVNEYFHFEVK